MTSEKACEASLFVEVVDNAVCVSEAISCALEKISSTALLQVWTSSTTIEASSNEVKHATSERSVSKSDPGVTKEDV